MSVMRPLKYCGIDVSKKTLVCAAIGELDEHDRQYLPGQASDLGLVMGEHVEHRTFSNSWKGFIQLTGWMRDIGVSTAVVESTGVYWCAVFTAVERAGVKIVLANSRQVKNVAGHKTDMRDSVWLAVLLRAGFVRPSYVPKGVIKDLRDATRMRARLVRDLARTKNRCHSVLDTVLVDLGLCDTFGKAARLALLRALRGDHTGLTWEQKRVFGSVSEVQRLIIMDLLRNMEVLEERVRMFDAAIAGLVEQMRDENGDRDIELLVTIPGMALTSAAVVKAEIGGVGRFDSPEKMCSYLGLVPRTYQSGPVSKAGGIVKTSNRHVRTVMYLVAQKCAQIGPWELREYHKRLKMRRNHHVATIALARRLMVVVWRMLRDKTVFRDAYNREMSKRKEERYRRELRRLKRIKREIGTEEFIGIVKGLLKTNT